MRKIFFVCLLIFLSGCATLPTDPIIPIGRSDELLTVCRQNNILWQFDALSHVLTLNINKKDVKVLIGSDTAFVDDEVILITEPITIEDSVIIVPPDFQRRVIDPIKGTGMAEDVHFPGKIGEIILDAGHGGKDPGAIGRSGIYEKTVVLDITKRLYGILKRKGYKVSLTRKDDTFISLKERTEIASRRKADLFVSIHANSNPTRSVHGLEVYTLRDLDVLERNEAQRVVNHKTYFKHLKMEEDDNNLKNILADMMYAHKQAETKMLAPFLAKETSRIAKTKNRGEKHARFYVLRNTLIPAILVEVGYLTNPKEERLLKTPSYRQKIALGLAESIEDYIHGKK